MQGVSDDAKEEEEEPEEPEEEEEEENLSRASLLRALAYCRIIHTTHISSESTYYLHFISIMTFASLFHTVTVTVFHTGMRYASAQGRVYTGTDARSTR